MDITTDPIGMKRRMKKQYKQYYANNHNVYEMSKFLERQKLRKFTQEEIDYVNQPIYVKENEL